MPQAALVREVALGVQGAEEPGKVRVRTGERKARLPRAAQEPLVRVVTPGVQEALRPPSPQVARERQVAEAGQEAREESVAQMRVS